MTEGLPRPVSSEQRVSLFTVYAEPELRDEDSNTIAVFVAHRMEEARRVVTCWNACEGIADPENFIGRLRVLNEKVPTAEADLATLVSERDALAVRVSELEGERDAALADSERRHTLLKMQHAESVELYNALSDLSFECDGVMCVLPPSRETYNRTFMVLKMKPHLSPAALRGHGESGGAALTTTSGDSHE